MKKFSERGRVEKTILTILAVGGFVALVVLAPNCLQLLKYLPGNKRNRSSRLFYIKTVAGRLVKHGLIEFKKNENGKFYLRITKEGRKELLKYQLREKIIQKPRRWDNKWRVIIFDIKEYKRGDRDKMRQELRNLGFIKLQNSVWVYPYECQEVITLFKSYFHFGKDLLYLTVENIENDKGLKTFFKLV